MTAQRRDPVDLLAGGLIVSCQALPGDPLDDVASLVALARSAEIGGAVGLRIARPEVVAAVRRVCTVPIIGITKHADRTRAFVTPVLEDARALVEAGADIVAVDATDRERPNAETAAEYVRLVRRELGVPVMADISTEDEGNRAFGAGADLVATTLSGFTPYSRRLEGPDIELVRRLAPRGRVVAEGRITCPTQLEAAFDAGAYAVVVGRAITRPQDIAARFAARTPARIATLRVEPPASGPPRASESVAPPPAPDGGDVRYWLGVDGGQSAVRATIIGSDGSIHGTGTAGTYDPVLAPGGRESLRRALAAAVGAAMEPHEVRLRGGFLGLSGVVAGGRIEQAVREAAHDLPVDRLFVDSDGRVALAGALGLRPGLIAIAGTGSSVFGLDPFGSVARAGGWGYLFGDEAGAFGIGRDAIRQALRQLDGGSAGVLARVIVDHLGLDDLAQVPKAFYAGEVSRATIATLTPRLAALAATGDSSASELFRASAAVLAAQLTQVAQHLSWEGDRVAWAPIGGVFESGGLLIPEIERRLADVAGLALERIRPAFPSEVGAALLAVELDPEYGPGFAAELAARLAAATPLEAAAPAVPGRAPSGSAPRSAAAGVDL